VSGGWGWKRVSSEMKYNNNSKERKKERKKLIKLIHI
jgi:hypothetical protein